MARNLLIRILCNGPIPKHIGFIMDGNRRFANKMKWQAKEGHYEGFSSLIKILDTCLKLGVKVVTVYAFSIENFKRSKDEVDVLMELAKVKMIEICEKRELLKDHGFCIRILGNLSYLSSEIKELVEKILYIIRATLNICFPYTSRDEMTNSVKIIMKMIENDQIQINDIDEKLFEHCLYTNESPPLDILIRTSGEIRLSDFLLWQEPIESVNNNIIPKNNSGSPVVTTTKTVFIEENEQMETIEDSKMKTTITTTTDAGVEIITDTANILTTTEQTIMFDEEEKTRLEEEARKFLSLQAQEIVIPSYSAWFDMAKIHNIEKKTLPEFFNNRNKSKNPSIYKEYRDFIINTYRLNPPEYLTVTACRRNLIGDVCAIIRIHAFLEQWGLINYQVDPDTRPSCVGPAFTGHFIITADTPRGLHPFQPTVDCTRSRYHSLTSQKLDLCPNCYLAGHYPTPMHSGDFLKMDETPFKHAQDEEWTEQETLALLEGIELYEDDWLKIAEHVGTRTRDQCILHFLEIPAEDPFNGAVMKNLGPLQYQRIPFSQADNPVLSVVAYLASIVDPNIASTAAKSAIKELSSVKSSSCNLKESNNGDSNRTRTNENLDNNNNDNNTDIKVKNEDSMDTEDQEIQKLVNEVIENQLKKLELKLQQFEELESVIENEKKELEKQRQLFYLERLHLKKNNLILQKQIKNGTISSINNRPLIKEESKILEL
ncbi:11223_t:CDS:10 [Entrophospora sp. SA101]|nr:11223_t:CDS:10 [Entrophospora sp. SA101]